MRTPVVLLSSLSLLFSGCIAAPQGITGPCPTPPAVTAMAEAPDEANWFNDTAEVVLEYGKQLEGFDESAAEACVAEANLIWRVVARDGEYFAVTADYSPQRVNAVIEQGVVTEITVG